MLLFPSDQPLQTFIFFLVSLNFFDIIFPNWITVIVVVKVLVLELFFSAWIFSVNVE